MVMVALALSGALIASELAYTLLTVLLEEVASLADFLAALSCFLASTSSGTKSKSSSSEFSFFLALVAALGNP